MICEFQDESQNKMGISREKILFLAVTMIFCAASRSAMAQDPSASGPEWVMGKLMESGAYETPAYFFTEAYDAYKVYSNLQGLFFDGLPYHGDSTKVFCWYGVPDGTQPGEKLPAVLLVHGGGGTVFPDWIKKWNDAGYIAISIALEGQVPGVKDPEAPPPLWPTHPYSGPHRTGFFADVQTDSLQDQWFYHAVADVLLAHQLLKAFPEVDTMKIGITGISWGGILTNVITGLDDQLAFAVPVYGCGYLYESPRYIGQMENLSPEARQFYLENWEPSLFVPDQNLPTLFVNGTNDCAFSMNSFMKTYHASPNEKYLRVEHNMKHGHGPGWNPPEIYRFADYITGNGEKPFEMVSSVLKADGSLTLTYNGEIETANMYYTVDTADWDCVNYEWKELPASVQSGTKEISGTLPWGTLYYFVNGLKTDGTMFSTPAIKVEQPVETSDTSVFTRDPLTAGDRFFFKFVPDSPVTSLPENTGTTFFTTEFTPSGSTFHEQCIEEDVFMARLGHLDGDSLHWDLRIGKGGQIYSLIGPYGENVPPQYRSWDFNTARWADDVWQTVNVCNALNNRDAFTPPPGTVVGRQEVAGMKYFIHAAGVYMNDPIFLEPSRKPFYSPQMASYYDSTDRSFSTMHWGQQAHIPSLHRAEVLNTTRFKDLGNGVIEVTYVSTNFGEVTVDRHNMPWGGIRTSSLPQSWLSKPDHTLELRQNTFGGDDPGSLSSIDQSGGYFIWAAEGEDENRPAFALVFGKDYRLEEYRNSFNMSPTQLRWGDVTGERDYSVFTVISNIDIPQGNSFYYRAFYLSGTMKQVHEMAIGLAETTDYGIIYVDPETAPLATIKKSDFIDAFREDIRLFTTPVEKMIPLFLMENTETGRTYICPDLYHDVNTAPFINPYNPGDPEYETYQERIVNKPYDGKIRYLRLLGYGVKKEKITANIRFALLDTLIQDTSKVILPEAFRNKIWVPVSPCFDCAFIPEPEEEEGLVLYNDFGNNQPVPWSDPVNLTFTDNEENPDPSDINPDFTVGKVIRGTGTHANVRFQLADYLDLEQYNMFKVKVYYEGTETLPSLCNIRLILRNNGNGLTQYAMTRYIINSNSWNEYLFDCSGAIGRDTYNQAWLFFSSPDAEGTTAGQVFYVDDLLGPPLTIPVENYEIYTSEGGDTVILDFTKHGDLIASVSEPLFTLKRNGSDPMVINEILNDTLKIYLVLDEGSRIGGRDLVTLSYSPGKISDEAGRILPRLKDREVSNNVKILSYFVTITALDAQAGSPLADVLVAADTVTEHTGLTGEAIMELAPGERNLTMSHPGYFTIDTILMIASDMGITLLMQESKADVKFRVLGTGSPLNMATVTINGISQETSSVGITLFEGLDVFAEYPFTVEKQDYESYSDKLYLEKDTTIEISLNLVISTSTTDLEKTYLFPVPAHRILHIESPKSMKRIMIGDFSGRTVYVRDVSGPKVTIPLEDLSSGFYIVSILLQDHSLIIKEITIEQ